MNRRIAARAIIINDGKILAAKLLIDGKPSDYWSTIGGGVDSKESLVPALRREILEETGVEPVIGSLVYVQQFVSRKGQENIEFFFNVTNGKDFEDIDLSKTTHGHEEIAEIGFIDAEASNIMPDFLQKENFQHIDTAQTKFFSYMDN